MNHVVMLSKGVGCTRCGEDWPFIPEGRGLRINLLVAAGKAFEKEHKRCRQRPEALPLTKPTTVAEWERSWVVGRSSAAIFYAFEGRPPEAWRSGRDSLLEAAPEDASDFERCVILLDIALGWRDSLATIARRVPPFAPLIPHWDRLEAMLKNEDPGLSAEIQRLRRGAK